MPGANTRALAKAATLDCDALIFDLEDAVAVASKDTARDNVVKALVNTDYGHRELIVRVNGLDTPWGAEDIRAIAHLPLHAVLVPKVDDAHMVRAAHAAIETAFEEASPAAVMPSLWAMIESPKSIIELPHICTASPMLQALVMGTSDLVRDLKAAHLANREPLLYALSATVNAARAHRLCVLDGVHLDFRNAETFRATCEQGRALGFDGRTLIHPSQVETANKIFGFSAEDIEYARRVLDAWQRAEAEGLGVVELDGQLIENLHADDARRLLALAESLQNRAKR
jgi:citrate lyase subunit beta/citryl-CoA lyase